MQLHTLENDDPALGEKSSKVLTEAQNRVWTGGGIDRNITRKPDRYIYLFTISKRSFIIERPPLFPRINVPACEPQEQYKLFFALPDPVMQTIMDWDKGRNIAAPDPPDAVRVAVDLINPNNISQDLDWACPEYAMATVQQGAGMNLADQGLFFDYDPVPSKKELKKAEARRHNYYNRLRMNADRLQVTNPKEMAQEVFFNNDYHLMADYFGLEYPWHKVMTIMATCPNCGEKIKQGVGFHKSEFGICVLDWRVAVEAGIKTRADVPEGKEFWGPGRPPNKASGVSARP